MTDPSALGRDMWIMLRPTFDDVARANGFSGPLEKAQLWAGFMSAANGGMYQQVGREQAKIINDGIEAAIVDLARSKMQVVKPCPT